MIKNRKLVKADPRYHELKKKNSIRFFLILSIPLFIFFVLQPFFLYICNLYLKIFFSVLLSAISYIQFIAILHGLSHDHFFRTKRNTYVFGKFISAFVFMDFYNYRKQHLDHHALVEKKNEKEFFQWKSINLLKVIINNLFLLHILKSLEKRKLNSKKSKKSFLITFFMHLFVILYFYQFSDSYFIASVYAYGFIGIGNTLRVIRSLCEHCIEKNKFITNSFNSNIFDKIFFCPFNANYHHEHHLFPNIPETRLVTVNSIINIKHKKSFIGTLFKYTKNSLYE